MKHKDSCKRVRIKDMMVLPEGKQCQDNCDCWCHIMHPEVVDGSN